MSQSGSVAPSLGEQAYQRLSELILHGDLHPGQRVTEKQVQALLSLGATPVRDALARLDSEGLIVTLPRRGYQVTPLTLKQIDDLFDLWRIIGPAMVSMASAKLGPEGGAHLRQNLIDARASDDSPVDASRKAWTGICLATDNQHLVHTFMRLELHLARVLFLTSSHLERVPDTGSSHPSVLDVLTLGDTAEMQRQTIEFIDGFHQEVVALLRNFPTVMSAELSFAAS